MDADRLLKTFLDLCRIPSPSRHERQVADYTRAALEAAGMSVEEDDADAETGGDCGNLIARSPGKGEPVLFTAHLDTVPVAGPIEPVVEGDWVRSSGHTILGADDKSAVALLIELARAAQAQPGRFRPLELLFTVCEETGLNGAKALEPGRLKARMGFALDGSDPDRVVRAWPGKVVFDITIHGRGGHATSPEDTINPIRIGADAVTRMDLGRLDTETTASVGVFESGSAVNVVPESARLALEVRSHDPEKLRFFADRAHLCVDQACLAARLLTSEGIVHASSDIRRHVEYEATSVPEDSPVVRRALEAVRLEGRTPRLDKMMGGTDALVLNQLGVACVSLGTGARAGHTHREHLVISEHLRSMALCLRLASA